VVEPGSIFLTRLQLKCKMWIIADIVQLLVGKISSKGKFMARPNIFSSSSSSSSLISSYSLYYSIKKRYY